MALDSSAEPEWLPNSSIWHPDRPHFAEIYGFATLGPKWWDRRLPFCRGRSRADLKGTLLNQAAEQVILGFSHIMPDPELSERLWEGKGLLPFIWEEKLPGGKLQRQVEIIFGDRGDLLQNGLSLTMAFPSPPSSQLP